MKKLLGIVVLGLVFYVNPIVVEDSNAFFKNPQEKCVDRILDQWQNNAVAAASKYCVGANKYTLKCIDRILDQWNNNAVSAAAKYCQGSDSSTNRCIDRILDQWNNNAVSAATKYCTKS